MIEAVVRIHLPCSWVTVLTEEHGSVVDIVEQKPMGNHVLRSLVEIDPGHKDPRSVVEALRANPDILDVETIAPEKGRVLATIQVKDCHACKAIAESECFLTDATATEAGGLEWHILAPNRVAVKDLVESLKARDLSPEVVSLTSAKSSGMLTDRQERVIGLAYKLGYFEFPKRISLTKLAKKLGVSKSTLSEVLRAGEAKVLHAYFHGLMRRPR